MLLGTLTAILWGSALKGRGVIRAGESTFRAGENFGAAPYKNIIKININLIVFIQEIICMSLGMEHNKYCDILNLDEYESIGTHWIAFYNSDSNVTSFNSSTYSKRNLKNHWE